jgi:hypothetical protein
MGVIAFAVKKPPTPPGPSTFTFLMHNSGSTSNQGVVLETALSQSNLGADFGYAYRSAMLSDQRVVVMGYDGNNAENEVRCFEAGTTTLDWSYGITGYELYEFSDISVLNNGNIVAAWTDYSTEAPYFIILNPSGGLVQGVTDGNTDNDGSNNSYPNIITPLADGGFCHTWRFGSTSTYISIWEANGSNRVAATAVEASDTYLSPPIQMPTGGGGGGAGGIITFDVDNGYVSFYNPSTGVDIWEFVVFTNESPVYVYSDKLSSWTDRVAFVFDSGGNIYGTIMGDDGNTIVEDKLILASHAVELFLALPDGTFLMQFDNVGSEYGQNYYILDSTLSISSGPHVGFTGLSSNSDYYLKGCAG